jgi:AraC-like DNA-binding protein
MHENESWLFLFVGFFCLLGLAVSLILYLTNRDKSFTPRILAAILFCLSYSLFGYLLYISKEFLRFPHLYRTPAFMSLCVAPLAYIYVRSSLQQAYKFRKWDILFFVPAILYTAQFIPFYLLPAQEKLYFIEKALESKAFGAREHEGLLPPGVGFFLRMFYSLGMIVAAYVLLLRWKNSTNRELLVISENNEIIRWLTYLTLVLSSTFLVLIIGFIFQATSYFERYRIPSLTVTLSIFFISAYLLIKPNILYGLKGWTPLPVPEDIPVEGDASEEAMSKRYSFTVEQGHSYKEILEIHFRQNHPFLQSRYSIRDLSREVGIPSYLLSAFINQEYGKNFNEFVNDNRVTYLIEYVERNPQALQQYTLEVLGQMGGFRSRASFISAMKRNTGKTPSEVFNR